MCTCKWKKKCIPWLSQKEDICKNVHTYIKVVYKPLNHLSNSSKWTFNIITLQNQILPPCYDLNMPLPQP